MKSVKEFTTQDQKAVNCIEFNPCAITLAYGSKDKTIRYWDLENYNLISQTPFDRLPIEQIAFESNGTHFFCATNEALKYWTINQDNNIKLVDCPNSDEQANKIDKMLQEMQEEK